MKYDFDLENKKEARKRLIRYILLTVAEVAAVLFAAFAVTHYGFETYTVASSYMSPTLESGDRILINKLSYRLHSIQRNDVVLIRQSGTEHNYYMIERVIGLPGETVQIVEGEIYINGKKLTEKYQFETMENGGLALEEITLDTGEYFVLCDNRNSGEDSRNASLGNILKEDIVGKAWFRMNTMEFVRYLNNT